MFRRSRVVILTAVLFFFLTAGLTAFARCLEDSGNLPTESQIGQAKADESQGSRDSLHCIENSQTYATGQQTILSKHKSNAKLITEHVAVSSKLASPFTSRISLASSSSLSPYGLVSVYQLNVVYRI